MQIYGYKRKGKRLETMKEVSIVATPRELKTVIKMLKRAVAEMEGKKKLRVDHLHFQDLHKPTDPKSADFIVMITPPN